MAGESTTKTSVRAQRASRALAEKLRESILGSSLLDGAALPTERELAASEGVSRSSVREALRMLEAEGLIATRPGRNGGPSVRRPTAAALERPLDAFIRGRAMRSPDLVEALLAIEPAIARIACAKRTDADLERLEELIRRLLESEDRGDRLAANAEFHVALAEASHNELLAAIMQGLAQHIYIATSAEALAIPGVNELAASSYERIRRAIADRDGDAADRRVRRHTLRAVEISRAGAIPEGELEAVRRARNASRTS